MTSSLLIAAFAMGFLGSPHCLGMCGGLVTAFGLSMKDTSPLKKRGLVATYHFGRLLSYSFLGVVASLIGITLLQPVMVGNLLPRVLLGLVLVFIGLTMLGAPFLNKLELTGMRLWQKLSPLRQKVFPITTFPRALAAGLLWGFLPCGLVYGALMMAVVGNSHSVMTGALLMFAFGLGTVPMLVATQETVGWLYKQIGRFKLRQLNGVIMILSGIAVIAVPIAMQYGLFGGHNHGAHGGHMAHGASSHMMHESSHTDSAMQHSDAHAMPNMPATADHSTHTEHQHMQHTQMGSENQMAPAMNHEHMQHDMPVQPLEEDHPHATPHDMTHHSE